jgi:hypothetical protein
MTFPVGARCNWLLNELNDQTFDSEQTEIFGGQWNITQSVDSTEIMLSGRPSISKHVKRSGKWNCEPPLVSYSLYFEIFWCSKAVLCLVNGFNRRYSCPQLSVFNERDFGKVVLGRFHKIPSMFEFRFLQVANQDAVEFFKRNLASGESYFRKFYFGMTGVEPSGSNLLFWAQDLCSQILTIEKSSCYLSGEKVFDSYQKMDQNFGNVGFRSGEVTYFCPKDLLLIHSKFFQAQYHAKNLEENRRRQQILLVKLNSTTLKIFVLFQFTFSLGIEQVKFLLRNPSEVLNLYLEADFYRMDGLICVSLGLIKLICDKSVIDFDFFIKIFVHTRFYEALRPFRPLSSAVICSFSKDEELSQKIKKSEYRDLLEEELKLMKEQNYFGSENHVYSVDETLCKIIWE